MAARRYGRRLRRTAAGTAVAAAAMAALSASQAPGFLPVAHAAAQDTPKSTTPPSSEPIDGGSPYITDLPPLNTPTGPVATPKSGGTSPAVSIPGGGASLPTTVLAAYQRAEATLAQTDPGCHLPWQLLAAIGQVESGQARGGAVDANGTTYTPILGPVLDGDGFANISDTDGGRYDGDAVHDRAVGPMQFIPSTWNTWGADGNGDGVKDPNNVYDAALAAGNYLCADGRDLAVPADMDRAILGYNHSQAYLDLVKAWYAHFRAGGPVTVPDRSGTPGPGIVPPPAPPLPHRSGGNPSSTPKPPVTVGGSVSPAPPTGGATTPPATGGSTTTPPTGGQTTTPPTGGETTTRRRRPPAAARRARHRATPRPTAPRRTRAPPTPRRPRPPTPRARQPEHRSPRHREAGAATCTTRRRRSSHLGRPRGVARAVATAVAGSSGHGCRG